MTRRRSIPGSVAIAYALAASLLWGGMTPVVAEDGEPQVVTEVAVHVGQVRRVTLHGFVAAYGMVEAEPATPEHPPASARIASPIAGVIARANCVEGQHVDQGAELFQLDSRVADVAVEKAAAAVRFAEATVARQQRLVTAEGTSQKLVQEAEQQLSAANSELAAARTQRALQTITAPLAGTIVRVNSKPGEAVDPTMVLAELIDMKRLVVRANVPSRELPTVQVGQTVELSTQTPGGVSPALPNGTVGFIGMEIDAKTDTAPVRIALPADAGLRPGQFVGVRIISDERPDRLAVPIASVVKTGDGSVIAVVDGNVATQMRVNVGLREGDLIEIAGDGVKEGMTVVTAGAYGLPKQTRVHILPESAATTR